MDSALDVVAAPLIFGLSPWLLVVLAAINLALTLVHALQERRGRLWRYFGAIAGVEIPDGPGRFLFFHVLVGTLWLIGLIATAGWLVDWMPAWLAAWSVGAIIGARLSDTVFSHVRLEKRGFRPNPGIESTRYYVAEAVAWAILFFPVFLEWQIPALIGVLLGGGTFIVVLPTIGAAAGWFGLPRHAPWQSGETMPDWARA